MGFEDITRCNLMATALKTILMKSIDRIFLQKRKYEFSLLLLYFTGYL